MNANDFRRIALSLKAVEESSHMGQPDFRVGRRIFATLAFEDQGYRNLMLTPEQQTDFVNEMPTVFIPIKGGWGRMGMTYIRLLLPPPDKWLHRIFRLQLSAPVTRSRDRPRPYPFGCHWCVATHSGIFRPLSDQPHKPAWTSPGGRRATVESTPAS